MTEEPCSKACAQCKHFYRHYVRTGRNWYVPLDQGHCSEPRCREKKADTPACHRFAKRPEGKR